MKLFALFVLILISLANLYKWLSLPTFDETWPNDYYAEARVASCFAFAGALLALLSIAAVP